MRLEKLIFLLVITVLEFEADSDIIHHIPTTRQPAQHDDYPTTEISRAPTEIPTTEVQRGPTEIPTTPEPGEPFITLYYKENTKNVHIPCNLDLANAVKVEWKLNGNEGDIPDTNAQAQIKLPGKTDLVIENLINETHLRGLFECNAVYNDGSQSAGTPYKIVFINPVPEFLIEVTAYVEGNVLEMYKDELVRYGFNGSDEMLLEKAEENLRAEMDYNYDRINALFMKNLNTGVTLNSLVVLNSNPVVSKSATLTLHQFHAFLKARNEVFRPERGDAFIMYIRDAMYDTEKPDVTALGTAYTDRFCDEWGYSNAVVKHDMTYKVVEVTAHEIGHLLGFAHNKDDEQGYLMQVGLSDHSSRRWKFSPKDLNIWHSQVKRKYTKCLTDHNKRDKLTYYPVMTTGGISPRMENPDSYCRRIMKTTSFKCEGGNVTRTGETLCDQVYCDGGLRYGCQKNYTHTPDGMICGHNKRCNMGKCETHPDEESDKVDDQCPYKDQTTVFFKIQGELFRGNCTSFIGRYTRVVCRDSNVNARCCDTCRKLKSDEKGCEWGDDWAQCGMHQRELICPFMKIFCCDYCRDYNLISKLDPKMNGTNSQTK